MAEFEVHYRPSAETSRQLSWEVAPAWSHSDYLVPMPDARAFDGESGGGIVERDIVSPVPDAFGARAHSVKRGRNKKGPTAEVKAYGRARVIGSAVSTNPDADVLSLRDRTLLKWELERIGAGRTRHGLSVIDIQKLTDRLYGPHGLEALCGTEVAQKSQIVSPSAECDHADGLAGTIRRCKRCVCSVAVSRSLLTGEARDGTVDAFVTDTSVYNAVTRHTSKRVTIPARLADKSQPRKAERETIYPLLDAVRPTPGEQQGKPVRDGFGRIVWLDVATGQPVTFAEHVRWVGHKSYPRASRAKRSGTRKPGTVRIARTIDAGTLPTDHEALDLALKRIEPGKAAAFHHQGLKVTVSRSQGRKLSARIGTGSEALKIAPVRTELAMVRKLYQAI